MFGISIDELMGVEKKKVGYLKSKEKINIGIVLTIIAIGLIILIGIILLFLKLFTSHQLRILIKQTEKNIQIELPNIESYEYFDTSTISTANSWYPNQSYYFMFKDDEQLEVFVSHLKNDVDWINYVDENIKDCFHFLYVHIATRVNIFN